MQRYTLKDMQRDFPDDMACLDWLLNYRYPNGITCKNCGAVNAKHHYIASRKSYSCQECGHHVHPTAGTIFHKSSTPLTLWFYAIYLMAQTRTGISAKQLERELGVTYKTAWRMFKLIRSRLDDEDGDAFGGDDTDVEVDETYVGGVRKGKRRRGAEGKTPVVGVVQRKGHIKAVVVPDVKSKTVLPIVETTVEKGTRVHTDEYQVYDKLKDMGYYHHRILHSAEIYVFGIVHTNTIEGFWAQIKNSVRGVHHGVSPLYLQQYVNEYVFRYNHRKDTTPMFRAFLCRVGVGLDG
jgi:transposase-like protein